MCHDHSVVPAFVSAILIAAPAPPQPPRPLAPGMALFPEQFPTLSGQRGLWLGAIHACRDNVVSAVRTKDRYGGDIVRFTFTPDIQPGLEEETTRLIEQQIVVRVDGRPISAPFVDASIRGLGLDIHPGNAGEARKIRAAALRPCR